MRHPSHGTIEPLFLNAEERTQFRLLLQRLVEVVRKRQHRCVYLEEFIQKDDETTCCPGKQEAICREER
ncbi:MAG: hypothetical protein ACFFCO_12180 [Promethearchaeota archaeon]